MNINQQRARQDLIPVIQREPRQMYAPFDGAAARLLSDNRDLYIAQSKATRNGVVAQPCLIKKEIKE